MDKMLLPSNTFGYCIYWIVKYRLFVSHGCQKQQTALSVGRPSYSKSIKSHDSKTNHIKTQNNTLETASQRVYLGKNKKNINAKEPLARLRSHQAPTAFELPLHPDVQNLPTPQRPSSPGKKKKKNDSGSRLRG